MIDNKDKQISVKAVIVAVSREYGVDHIQVFRNSVTKVKFKIFLEDLRSKHPFEDILLVMDNLSFHKSIDVKERMDALGFLYTYTPVYSPRHNGIERVFNIAKRAIKKERLTRLLNGFEENMLQIIHNAFYNINI